MVDDTQLITILSICLGSPLCALLLYCWLTKCGRIRHHDYEESIMDKNDKVMEENSQDSKKDVQEGDREHSIIDPFEGKN